jgi:glycine/D-amino acid oxidase-like deaminating enzyme
LFDAIIVGSGIVGAACARELADAGLIVGVCDDSGSAGGGATAAGMGHIAVMDDSEAQFAITNYSQRLWWQLARTLPGDAEFAGCGSLWVAADEFEMAEVHRKSEYYSARGVAVDVLDSGGVAKAEPNLRRGLAGGLRMSADAVCYAPAVARHLLRGVARLNARVCTRFDGGVQLQDGSKIEADAVVVATGAGARDLLPELPVRPRKGHLVITDRYPGYLRHQIIELGYLRSAHSDAVDSVAFNIQPRVTGQLLIGSSRQLGVETPAVERDVLRRMLARAVDYMPGLGKMSVIRSWTGFRAATPDNLPLIGRYSGSARTYVAAGHEGLGISTSLGTAKLLADEILGRQSAIPRGPYSPGRSFAGHGEGWHA